MLAISGIRGEPPPAALRASDHLNEAQANLFLLIASAPIRHDPRICGGFNITCMHFSHLLDCESVDIDVQLIIFHLHAPNLSIEVLKISGRLAMLAFLDTFPQH